MYHLGWSVARLWKACLLHQLEGQTDVDHPVLSALRLVFVSKKWNKVSFQGAHQKNKSDSICEVGFQISDGIAELSEVSVGKFDERLLDEVKFLWGVIYQRVEAIPLPLGGLTHQVDRLLLVVKVTVPLAHFQQRHLHHLGQVGDWKAAEVLKVPDEFDQNVECRVELPGQNPLGSKS